MKFGKALGLVLTLALALTLAMVPMAHAANGPRMGNLLIKMYSSTDTEFAALEANEIDFTDSSLTKDWSDKWKAEQPTTITQVPYAEMGMREFDLNNQAWPTGVMTPRIYDPLTDSYKNYFDPTDTRHKRAWMFRVALARLTNKPAWIIEILKGFGKSVDSFVPDPAAAGWIWPGFRTSIGASPAEAADLTKTVIGAIYQLGAKGYDWKFGTFVSSEEIQTGYYWHWDQTTYGSGLDCSGLVFWSYNKVFGTTSYGNSIVPEGADGQWRACSRISKDALMPGDLLFFGTGTMSHVAMYVGQFTYESKTYNVVHASGWVDKVTPASYSATTNMLTTFKPTGERQDLNVDGYGRVTDTYKLPYFDNESPAQEPYHHDYDPTRAEQLLNAAGFTRTWSGDPDGGGPMPSGLWRSDPQNPGNHIPLLKVYVPNDDPLKLQFGRRLRDEMLAVGIPLEYNEANTLACSYAVILKYQYHIYIGGWDFLGADPDYLFDLWHSIGYWGGTETSSEDPTGLSGGSRNYAGFCNTDYDEVAESAKYPPSFLTAKIAAYQCQTIYAKYVGSIPLYASKAVMAYRTGWQGAVNFEGMGVDNSFTYLNAYNPTPAVANTIRYGIMSSLEHPNIITSRGETRDWQLLWLGYESLIDLDPFNVAQEYGWLALPRGAGRDGVLNTADDTFATIGTWDPPGDVTTATTVTFTVRTNAKWHEGATVTPDDVKFSLEFTRDCGLGVAWNYVLAMDIVDVLISGNDVTVRFGVLSFWAAHWAGYLPILSKSIWMAANNKWGWGYGTAGWDPAKVREYAPYASYVAGDPNKCDGNNNGIPDAREDGCGPWKYYDMDPTMSVWASLTADPNYFKSQSGSSSEQGIETYLLDAFHKVGDVNYDRTITAAGDGVQVARASGTNKWDYPSDTTGTRWDYYNPNADLNGDGYCDAFDMYWYGKHYLMCGFPPAGL